VVNRRTALELNVGSVGAKRAVAIRESKAQLEFSDRRRRARMRAFGLKFEFKSCRGNRRRDRRRRAAVGRSVHILAFVPAVGILCGRSRPTRLPALVLHLT
jgi:hypothetical protein